MHGYHVSSVRCLTVHFIVYRWALSSVHVVNRLIRHSWKHADHGRAVVVELWGYLPVFSPHLFGSSALSLCYAAEKLGQSKLIHFIGSDRYRVSSAFWKTWWTCNSERQLSSQNLQSWSIVNIQTLVSAALKVGWLCKLETILDIFCTNILKMVGFQCCFFLILFIIITDNLNTTWSNGPRSPFKEWPCFPDVGVAHASSRGFCDILLLKELLDGLSHHGHGIIDMCWLILPVDELEADQTWDQADNKR